MQSSRNGNIYEKKIYDIVKNCTLNGKLFNTQTVEELAGSSSKNDIVCDFIGNKDLGIEVKNNSRAEYIQVDVHKEGDKFYGPKKQTRTPVSILNRYLDEINKQKNIYYGCPPQLPFESREIFDKWEEQFMNIKREKEGNDTKKDYTWIPSDHDFVIKNYNDKGNTYIQINKYGLYHLGNDICGLGVPQFKPKKTILRLRLKRRGSKGCIPSSLTLSAWVSGLEPSPYSLDDKNKLPINLHYNSNQ